MVWARQLLLTLLVSCNAAESLPKWELQDPARAEQNINELTSILFGAHGKGINPSKELKYWKSPCCGKESSTEQEGMLICMGFQMLLHTNTNSHVHSIGSLQKWWMDGCRASVLTRCPFGTFTPALWSPALARSTCCFPSQSTDSEPGRGVQGNGAQLCFPSWEGGWNLQEGSRKEFYHITSET